MIGTIADVLSQKGTDVVVIKPEATIQAAVDLMAVNKIGALVVVEHGRPVGLFHERDVLWRIVHERRGLDTLVGEVMATRAATVKPSTRVGEAMRIMTDQRVRHLPVVERERLMGLVSIGDLTHWVTQDLEAHVGQLVGYIHGHFAISQPISS